MHFTNNCTGNMSKQTTLNSFFKANGRSLSHSRTPRPYKSPEKGSGLVNVVEVMSLSSSSEDLLTPSDSSTITNSVTQDNTLSPVILNAVCSPNESICSSETIIYCLSQSTPRTPNKTLKSPRTKNNFFSPTKKRLVTKKSPGKRKLTLQFNDGSIEESCFGDEVNAKHYGPKFQDDKTLFFISIIDKYLKDDALKQLLDEPSQDLLSRCIYITEPGLRIVCRLYWRQSVWCRTEELEQIASDKMKYAVDNIPTLLQSLVDNGLIVAAQSEGKNSFNFDDYVKLLKKSDLQEICKELKLKSIQSKQDAINALRKFSQNSGIGRYLTGKVSNNKNRVLNMLRSKTGQRYKLSDIAYTTFYNLYVLMYLGIDYTIIREKRLEFVLLLDKINKETYPIDKNKAVDNASIVFQTREEFYRYLAAHMIYEDYIKSVDLQEKCDIIMKTFKLYKNIRQEDILRYKSIQPWLRRFTPANIYVKILENGVHELKKLKVEAQYMLAVEILDSLIRQIAFRQHKKAEWYAEKALILHKHLKNSEQAANILLEGFEANGLSEEAKDAMRPRAKLIANQRNVALKDELRQALKHYAEQDHILESSLSADHVNKQPMDNYQQRGKLKFEAHTEEGRSILTAEEYCIFYYKHQGEFTHGEHWEGRMVITIFFLLFWDIIYTKPTGISGIFLNHYQRHPLDLYSENFYINRKTLIDDRLIIIEESTEDMIIEKMQNRWEERPEHEVSYINRSIAWSDVAAVVRCLGPRPIAAICRRLATNYGYTHSGFPDLTMWNVHTNTIKFVEVKTDADKPSVKQLQWLQYLTSHKMAAGFCYVGVNSTRCKARPRDTSS